MDFKKKWEFFHKNRALETKTDHHKSVKFGELAKKYYEEPTYVKSGDPTILLANARVRLAKTQKKLDKVKNQSQLTKQQIDEHWEELVKNEEAFIQNFVQFENFIKSNREKRVRAANKIKEDKLLADKGLADTTDLGERLSRYYEYKEKLEKEVKVTQMYENFIFTVCKNMPNMDHPMKLIQRYEMLHETGIMSARKQEDSLIKLENAKHDIMKLADEKDLIIIGLNTKLLNLCRRYENARYRTLCSEKMVDGFFEKAGKRLSEIFSVKKIIWYMYLTMCKFKNHKPTILPNDVEQLLVFIKESLAELSNMRKGLRFGLMQTKMGLIKLITNYRISLNAKTKVPVELDLDTFVLFTKSPIILKLDKL